MIGKKGRSLTIKQALWLLCLISICLQMAFIVFGQIHNVEGFPLDDAWIHLTYARNLMETGSWSYNPGVTSGGSTSPLWTVLLTFGFFFRGNGYVFWTLGISALLFCLMILFLSRSFINLHQDCRTGNLFLFGLIASLEWHLQWAAVSGMETILYCLMVVLLLFFVTNENKKWWLVGSCLGIIAWIRPDGLTLWGPVVFAVIEEFLNKRFSAKQLAELSVPFIIIFAGYLLFNWYVSGNILPNTFYAKQTEYRELLTQPILQRIFNEFLPIWTGVCILLIPGFIYKLYTSVRKKKWGILGFILWVIGFVCLYAIRLPVIYQHGRYIIPVIPVFLLIGFTGTLDAKTELLKATRNKTITFAVCGLLIALASVFYIRGIYAYRSDLKVIDTFMVQPAKWIAANTKETSIIAVHDIGAMGFYSGRRLIDLAGLINPEIIPFIRDEQRIHDYMLREGSNYYVGFADWYSGTESWGMVIKEFEIKNEEIDKKVEVIELKY